MSKPVADKAATATSNGPQKAISAADAKSAQADPEQLALASLCHVLLNLNEFIYVD